MGGLNVNTTDEGLREHFSQYGEVADAVVMRDKEPSNKSRGFGFVTFESNESMRECLNHPHLIDSKDVSFVCLWSLVHMHTHKHTLKSTFGAFHKTMAENCLGLYNMHRIVMPVEPDIFVLYREVLSTIGMSCLL